MKYSLKSLIAGVSAILCGLVLCGCQSGPQYSVQITPTDMQNAAQALTQKLQASGKLDTLADDFGDKKPVLLVDVIRNNTGKPLNMTPFVETLVSNLDAFGAVEVFTNNQKTIEQWLYQHPDEEFLPDLILSGSITARSELVGSAMAETRTYFIQADINRDGRKWWGDHVEVIKKDRD